MKKNRLHGVVLLLFLSGFALLGYPVVTNWIAEKTQTVAIQHYKEGVSARSLAQIEEEKQKAREYNAMLTGVSIEDPFVPGSGSVLPENYTSVLDFDGPLAYLEIPRIGQRLPVFHGAGSTVLEKGVGHLDATAFPIGGEGNHAVLTGHRGLVKAKLFTDLDKLEPGDIFYIYVLDETLVYEVDRVLVVEPQDTEELRPVAGEDYVTLITCTPYGINSHRLFVRGRRIFPGAISAMPAFPAQTAASRNMLLFAGLAGVFVLGWVFVLARRRQKKQRRGAGK